MGLICSSSKKFSEMERKFKMRAKKTRRRRPPGERSNRLPRVGEQPMEGYMYTPHGRVKIKIDYWGTRDVFEIFNPERFVFVDVDDPWPAGWRPTRGRTSR